MRELTTADEVRSASADDTLIMWAAQGLRPGARAWALGDSIAVACPDLFRRDRVFVLGEPAEAAALARHALAECGPSYRVLGDESLLREVTLRVPELRFNAVFGWMDTDRPTGATTPPIEAGTAVRDVTGESGNGGPGEAGDEVADVRWLPPSDDPDVAALLRVASPSAWAQPGISGVRRWAGLRRNGELVAVAADAWSAPAVGLIAGVATDPAHRGKGYAEAVCRLAATTLVAAHGRVALMVDADNFRAIRLYERLGFVGRAIATSSVGGRSD
ncbi:GNAT family N-acetyltransferase [Thermopolyspora sp. NPDC052614]|uniref:GNAT family N-acetyltransferase n=1 Tax=Thermopolyspora sp. NPDC052614 TaxID=3155682 RepID=UPI00341AB73E